MIAVLWAGFWMLFAVASVVDYYLGEPGPRPGESPLKSILVAAAFVLVLSGAIYLAWRPPFIAGISYVLISVVVTAAYFKLVPSKMILVQIGLPPLISGILFLLSARRPRIPIT